MEEWSVRVDVRYMSRMEEKRRGDRSMKMWSPWSESGSLEMV